MLYSNYVYFTTSRSTANSLMYRGLDVGYNSSENVRTIRSKFRFY